MYPRRSHRQRGLGRGQSIQLFKRLRTVGSLSSPSHDRTPGPEWSWESPDGGYFSSSETSSAIEATSQTFWELTLAVPDSMTVERSDSYALAYEDDARDRWFVLFAKLPSGPAALQTLEGYAAALLQGEAVEEVDLTAAEDTPPASSGVATHSVSSRFTSDGTYGQMTVNTFQDSNWVYTCLLYTSRCV